MFLRNDVPEGLHSLNYGARLTDRACRLVPGPSHFSKKDTRRQAKKVVEIKPKLQQPLFLLFGRFREECYYFRFRSGLFRRIQRGKYVKKSVFFWPSGNEWPFLFGNSSTWRLLLFEWKLESNQNKHHCLSNSWRHESINTRTISIGQKSESSIIIFIDIVGRDYCTGNKMTI